MLLLVLLFVLSTYIFQTHYHNIGRYCVWDFWYLKWHCHRFSWGQLCNCSINALYSFTIRPAILGPFEVRIL